MLLPPTGKIPILLAETVFIWKAFTPPHTSSSDERLPPTFVGRFAVTFVSFMKVSMIYLGSMAPASWSSLQQIAHVVSCLCETILILSYHNPDVQLAQAALSTFSRPLSNGAGSISITPSFLVGSVIAIAGAQIRLACYRALGRLFTFEMAVRSGHKLVTDGSSDVPELYRRLLISCKRSICVRSPSCVLWPHLDDAGRSYRSVQ